MTHKEFTKYVKENANMKSQAVADDVVRIYLKTLKEAMETNDKIIVKGFGSFNVIETKPRKIVVPVTKVVRNKKKRHYVPTVTNGHTKVIFKPSEKFKNLIKEVL